MSNENTVEDKIKFALSLVDDKLLDGCGGLRLISYDADGKKALVTFGSRCESCHACDYSTQRSIRNTIMANAPEVKQVDFQ